MICVAPFDIFWMLLSDPQDRDLILYTYGDSTANTLENRRKAYASLLAQLRARGALCDCPAHEHEETMQ
jgi:hypothetical protein